MKQKTRRILLALLSAVFLVSAGVLVYELAQYQKGDDAYSEAESLVDLPLPPAAASDTAPLDTTTEDGASTGEGAGERPVYVDPYADSLRNMDFTALQAVNQEVLGWVLIPGTKISYPLVQGRDNSYYLNHTWKKTNSAVGAIFMDYRCGSDLSGFNTIVYGHRMNNGSMFAGLKYYKKSSYLKQHPIVYLTTAQGTYHYEIFSVYEGSPTGESYRLGIKTEASKQAFLDMAVGASLYDTGVQPTVNDAVLTLSTCTGNGHSKRLIVHAVRRGYAASDQAADAETEAPPDAAEQPAQDALSTETPAEVPAPSPDTQTPEADTAVPPDVNQTGDGNAAGDAAGTEGEALSPPSGDASPQE